MQNLSNESMVHGKNNGIEYLQFKKLLEYEDTLQHAITLRASNLDFGLHNNEEKYSNIVKENYIKICNELNLDYTRMVRPKQKHTDIIKRIDDIDIPLEALISVDGLITNKQNIFLSLVYADCIPLLFFDPIKKVVANIHSGWKGTLQRIGKKAINKMQLEYNCNPKDIICAVGPSIRKCHFEVDYDVAELFINEFKDISNFIINKSSKYYIDTVYINKKMLQYCGILEENIIDSNLCTVCNSEQIYSYRGAGDKFERFTVLIGLKINDFFCD